MEVRLNSTLRGRVGRRAFEIGLTDAMSVRQVLAMMAEDAPDLTTIILDAAGNLQPNFVIFRNGRNIEFFAGLDTLLHPSDTLDIFPKTGAQRAFATT